jgi:hypothetical protein
MPERRNVGSIAGHIDGGVEGFRGFEADNRIEIGESGFEYTSSSGGIYGRDHAGGVQPYHAIRIVEQHLDDRHPRTRAAAPGLGGGYLDRGDVAGQHLIDTIEGALIAELAKRDRG